MDPAATIAPAPVRIPRMPRCLDVVGALLLILGLPAVTYYIWICLTDFDGTLVMPSSRQELVALAARIPVPTLTAVVLYVSWLLLQALLQIFAPGKTQQGTPLADGSRLDYKMNGWFSFWFTCGMLFLAVGLGWLSPTVASDQFGPLLTTANIAAFTLSLYLYLRGSRSGEAEASGSVIQDYFAGLSLNPRLRNFDFKFFLESRPGLILWIAIDFSLAAKQYERHGVVSTPMILVNAFQFLYVADYFFHEEAILTTWDIKHEKVGWMLCWGGLVWVPFVFTIQAHYLVDHPHEISAPAAAGIIALNIAGYAIFRGANLQKHKFRSNPKAPVWGKPPEYIQTASGTLLLTCGWWGMARHLNYMGDLLMGLAWCLPTGFEHPLPYFYIIYLTILLVHRQWRDHALCLEKYGKDWEAYCRKVRWRIVPGIY